VNLPQFSEQDSDINSSKSSRRPHVKTKHKGTPWLAEVADRAKFSVATLAETFYHVPFMKY
jgi:hypothetical protein